MVGATEFSSGLNIECERKKIQDGFKDLAWWVHLFKNTWDKWFISITHTHTFQICTKAT